MTEIEKVRKRLLELTRACNTTRGEEREKLLVEKEKVWQQYDKMRKQKWREEEERWTKRN